MSDSLVLGEFKRSESDDSCVQYLHEQFFQYAATFLYLE